MTTADLIKKREEEMNKPLEEKKPSFTALGQVSDPAKVNMQKIDNTANNKANAMNTIVDKIQTNTPLYDAGVKLGNKGNTEATLKGKSPITTPEYEKFRNEVIGARDFGVETEEQRKAREKRDFIKQGLTGFTDGLTALANLYYTTKGAPNQKQTYQLPALQQQLYKERLERDKKLENFRAWQRAKAEKDADRAYQEKIRKEQQAREDAIRKEQQDREDKITAQNQANLDRTFEYKVEQDALDREERGRQTKESNNQFWANYNLQKEKLNARTSSPSSSVMHNKNGTSILNTKNGFLDVDWKKVGPIAKNQLYNAIPKEIRDKYPLKDLYGEYDEKYATSQMNAAIAEAAVTDENIAKFLVDSKAASYQQQETNPTHSNTQQSGTQQTNGDSGATDFSKQKRGGGQSAKIDLSQYEIPSSGGAQQTTMANVTPKPTDAAPSNTPQGNTQQGNVFEQLSAKYSKEDADEKAAKDAELQQRIADMETEKRDSLNLANEYQKELDELNKMQMLNPRNYAGSRKREVQDAINEVVARKKFLEKEIKELKAKAKNLDKEYERLYPYKKR